MKLTPEVVTQFEKDQATYGTKVAMFNLLYLKATDDLHALGVQKVQTQTRQHCSGD